MKTHKYTFLNHVLTLTLTVAFLVSLGYTKAGEPVTTSPTYPGVHANSETAGQFVTPAGYSAHVASEGGIPLAREDVVPIKTAVTGTGSSPAPEDMTQMKISSRAT